MTNVPKMPSMRETTADSKKTADLRNEELNAE
jgi:hypothetical protein